MELYLYGYAVAFVLMSLLNCHEDSYWRSSAWELIATPLLSWLIVVLTLGMLAYYYHDYKSYIKD